MHFTSNLFAVGALLVATGVAAAQGQILKTACDSAEAVITGTIEPVTVTSYPAVFTIAVDTTIKGALTPGAVITSVWPGSLTAAKMRPDRYRALWFLTRNGTGMWEILAIGGPNAPLFASGLSIPTVDKGSSIQKPALGTSCYEAVWNILKPDPSHVDESLEYTITMNTLFRENPMNMAAAISGYRTRSPSVRPVCLSHPECAGASRWHTGARQCRTGTSSGAGKATGSGAALPGDWVGPDGMARHGLSRRGLVGGPRSG